MDFGLTSAGYVIKRQQQIIAEINADLQSIFGANINLGPESIFGQIVGLFSEREALLWELGDAIYSSQYPSGAEGTSVDNILALNNLKRLAATPTKTNNSPTTQPNGITLYGLVLRGTPGTIIPKDSVIQNLSQPPLSFLLDNQVTIGPAINAIQTIFFGNIPNAGAFAISIEDPNGEILNTPSIPFSALASNTKLNISTTPAGGSSFQIVLTRAGIVQTTAAIPTSGVFPTALAIQNAIRLLTGYSAVVVTGGAGTYVIDWAGISNPVTTITANTTLATITIVNSVQSSINNLVDPTSITTSADTSNGGTTLSNVDTAGLYTGMLVTGTGIPASTYIVSIGVNSVVISNAATADGTVDLTFANFYPYTDVQVTGAFSSGSFVVRFGMLTVINNNPDSVAQPEALITIVTNSLLQGIVVTNINIVSTAIGAPAQAIGSATCNQNGPNFVGAGTLTVIGTPVTGWDSVTNQLDCITGTNVETDTEALARRDTLLSALANGPIQSIVQKVRELTGVTAVVGFTNLTGAAQQVITFASVPVSGTWKYTVGGETTSPLAFNATAAQLQTAIQALQGFDQALVTGNVQFGFVINFNGSNGGQSIALGFISNNTTGVQIFVNYGRPPKSFEIVVEGGLDADIGQKIFDTQPAGILSYSTPTAITTGSATFGSNILTLTSVVGIEVGNAIFGAGVAQGAVVVSIGVGNVTMSLAAVATSSGAKMIFNHTIVVFDEFNNPVQIAFSRPTPIPIYVSIALVTDIYNIPGDSLSGANPNAKFQPGSVVNIQSDIVTIGSKVAIGGLVIGFGSDGLIGAFNDVPGIISYTLYFGLAPAPVTNTNIQMQAEQRALFEQFNIVVSFT